MKVSSEDRRWLQNAARLAARARPSSRPNPAVAALVVKDGVVVGRGWTQPGGRPHAEAAALKQAGAAAKGSTIYVTLEPCAHDSARGPDCSGLIQKSGAERVVIGVEDPDPRTAGSGIAGLRRAGIAAEAANDPDCRESLAGYLMRRQNGRPFVTLKLAMSLDGCIALANGSSRWITGAAARAHGHMERARSDAILVGGGTLRADEPRLDVRLAGLEQRSPRRCVLSSKAVPEGWTALGTPTDIANLENVQYLLIEGGAQTAAAFLSADLVDRLAIYRAPIVVGSGLPSVGDIGLTDLADAHGRWHMTDRRLLGTDTLEVYERAQ